RAVLRDPRVQGVGHAQQPLLGCQVRVGAHDVDRDEPHLSRGQRLHDAQPAPGQPRVDAEDPHAHPPRVSGEGRRADERHAGRAVLGAGAVAESPARTLSASRAYVTARATNAPRETPTAYESDHNGTHAPGTEPVPSSALARATAAAPTRASPYSERRREGAEGKREPTR